MRLQTPYRFARFAYLGIDTGARSGDELFGAGIGRLYVGIYPTARGFDLSMGLLDRNDRM